MDKPTIQDSDTPCDSKSFDYENMKSGMSDDHPLSNLFHQNETVPSFESINKKVEDVITLEKLKKEVPESVAILLYECLTTAVEVLIENIAFACEDKSNENRVSEQDLLNSMDVLNPSLKNHDTASCTLHLSNIAHKVIKELDTFPPSFDNILQDVATTGICRIPWSILRMILILKAEKILSESVLDNLTHSKPLNTALRPVRVYFSYLWKLSLAPFTIQRASEFLLTAKPDTSQRSILKFLYSLCRTINFVTIWMSHDICESVEAFQNILQDDANCNLLLKSLNPGHSSSISFTFDNHTPLHSSSSRLYPSCDEESLSCNTQPVNEDEEEATTPHLNVTTSNFSKDSKLSYRKSRNSFEVYTPRRGCCTEAAPFASDALQDTNDGSLKPSDISEAQTLVAALSSNNPEDFSLSDNGILSIIPRRRLIESTSKLNETTSEEHGDTSEPLKTYSTSSSELGTFFKQDVIEDETVKDSHNGIQTLKNSRSVSSCSKKDDDTHRPCKRMKFESFLEIPYIKFNYSEITADVDLGLEKPSDKLDINSTLKNALTLNEGKLGHSETSDF